MAAMKVRYLGETSFLKLTRGKVYDVIAIEKGWYRIVDDSGEDYLYLPDEFEVAEPCWFHPEEAKTVGVLLDYFGANPGSSVTVTYEGGESYRCRFYSSYDADNESELDEDADVEPIDYFAIAIDPFEVLAAGSHYAGPDFLIELSYRDFPQLIVAEDGTTIYKG